jgi:hypothetical protein
MSQLSVDAVDKQSGSTLTLGGAGTTVQPHASATLSGFGKVLQVVQTVKNDTFSTSSSTFTDITGLNASITPSSSSSKILIQVSIGNQSVSPSDSSVYYRFMRDSTPIGLGDSGNPSVTFATTINADRGQGQGMMYLDSPSSTSSINYKVQAYRLSGTFYINTRPSLSYISISTITLMEIGA